MEREKELFSVSARMVDMRNPEIMDGAGDLYSALGWAYAIGKGKPAPYYGKPRKLFSACAGAAIYRKSALELTGDFDVSHFAYLEDVDIGYRARILGFSNAYEPSAVVLHAGSATSGSRYNEFKVFYSARKQCLPDLQEYASASDPSERSASACRICGKNSVFPEKRLWRNLRERPLRGNQAVQRAASGPDACGSKERIWGII